MYSLVFALWIEKEVAILGIGKYGRSLAKNLYDMGIDVLVADSAADTVSEFTGYAAIACHELGMIDCTD